MATFDDMATMSAAELAAAAAVSADTATRAANAILEHKQMIETYINQEIDKAMGTLREELAAVKRELEQADSNLRESIAATDKNVEDNYVKNTDYATETKAGLTKIGDNLKVDAAGRVSVPVATSATFGVMRPGKCMSVANGILTFTLDGYRGGVDIALADGSAAIALSAGLVDMVATQKVRAKVSAGCQSELNVKSNGLSYLATRSGTGYNLFSVDVGTSYDGVNVGNAAFALYMRGSNV